MTFIKKIATALIGFGLLAAGSLPAQDYLDNALYVKFKETSSVSAKKFQREVVPFESLNLKISEKKMAENGFHREATSMSLFDDPFLDRTFTIRFDSTANIEKIIRILEKDPNVELVERVPIFKLFSNNEPKSVPNDPYYQAVDGIEYLWYLKMINAEKAWKIQQGDSNIKVAVVDGAVWGEHPDLNIPSNLQYNAYTKSVGSSAPDYNNQDAQCSTLYAPEGSPDPCPVYTWSHGTHCAGVVGAINNNGIGISSLASGVTLMGISSTTSSFPGSVVSGYEGIRWAAQNGAKVISCSWGSSKGGGDIGNAILRTCFDNNITVVVAAGNDNTSERGEPSGTLYVITVGSVDENGNKSSFSNYGNWVDILAPGGSSSSANKRVGIVSTTYCKSQSLRLLKKIDEFNDQYYDEMEGTSMATPLVSSLCGLMLSKDSTLTPDQIKYLLQYSSTLTNSSLFNPNVGIINAEAALKAIDEVKFGAPVEGVSVVRADLDSVWFCWTPPTTNDHPIKGYRTYYNGTIVDSCTTETSSVVFPVPSGKNRLQVGVLYEDGSVSPLREVRYTTPEIYRISTASNPKTSGKVEGAGRYAKESSVTLKAIPNEGYKFLHWKRVGNSSILSTRPEYTFRALGNYTYIAYFESETANEDNENASFTVVPNPAKDQVKISCPAAIKNLSVCDLQGRTVKQENNINEPEWTINVENLAKGTYIIVLQTATGTMQQKFVKL